MLFLVKTSQHHWAGHPRPSEELRGRLRGTRSPRGGRRRQSPPPEHPRRTSDSGHEPDPRLLEPPRCQRRHLRTKDLVMSGGENIGCGAVEAALLEHHAVAEASVYGVPDERPGEDFEAGAAGGGAPGAPPLISRPVKADPLPHAFTKRMHPFRAAPESPFGRSSRYLHEHRLGRWRGQHWRGLAPSAGMFCVST
jgi:hypothetical protein